MHGRLIARGETTHGEAIAAALRTPLDRAIALLGAEPPWLRVREAEQLLRDVEARLGVLGTLHADNATAWRLLRLRDDLSSHLCAASICKSDELPPAVIAHLLRQGAWLTQSTIADIRVVVPSAVEPDGGPRQPDRFSS
jgi:hypothetical protein